MPSVILLNVIELNVAEPIKESSVRPSRKSFVMSGPNLINLFIIIYTLEQ
jgi:hypothetical protein